MTVIDWLLDSDSDPAIRWQAMRDLADASPAAIAAERTRVPREGLGARILACQGADGSWHCAGSPDWLINLFTMQLLRATGADPADPAVNKAAARRNAEFRWPKEFGAYPFFEGEVEPCINGGVLALGAYFGRPSESLAQRLVSEQLEDGGWNCEAPKSKRSSYHTTICVLEGLLEYERALGSGQGFVAETAPVRSVAEAASTRGAVVAASARGVTEIAGARRRGEEYLLERGLFRRLSTGEVASPAFLKFAYPPRYCYDVLRALDYFRAASTHDQCSGPGPSRAVAAAQNAAIQDPGARNCASQTNVQPDPRIADAVRIVESSRQPDGRWLLDDTHSEALAFPFPESIGQPSRWNTLRALRVLRCYG